MGDGFLVDALCAEGYTYSWYFRNQVAPKKWTDKGLSPLHSQVMSLLEQLPNGSANYICGMDNLFNSPKFAKCALKESGKAVMTHGVCRPSQGIPSCIIQEAATRKLDLLRQQGTLKAAVLTGDPECKGLVAASLYDTKPVYLISSACKKVEWRKKERKLWHNDMGKKVDVPFYQLNLID